MAVSLPLAHAQPTPAGPRAALALTDWSFQPGVKPETEPAAADWAPVKLPFWWSPWVNAPLAQAGKSWEKLDLKTLDSGWLQTQVAVPADWNGRRLYLKLEGLQCDAIVWVNGQRIGEVQGPDARVDVSPAVTPGQEAQIRLWVTRWWAGLTTPRSANAFRDMTIKALATSEWYAGEDAVRLSTIAGIMGETSLQAVPAAAEIDNVLAQPSFRTKALGVDVDYLVHTAVPGESFQVSVSELNGQTAGLPRLTVPAEPVSDAAEVHRQVLTLPWQNPHLWDVGAPYLYFLNVDLVDASGQVLDHYPPVRFGFREVWTEGRILMLNGHPLRLRLTPFVDDLPHLIFFEGLGFNAIEFQPNMNFWYATQLFPTAAAQSGTQELLDAADEQGLAVLMPVPSLYYVRDRLLEPAVSAQFLRDTQAWMRRLDRQNRPSILMWAPSMNTATDYDPLQIGRKPMAPQAAWYAKSEELLKSLDPTRLVFHHQGGPNGDVEMTNLYLNFQPLQEGEEFLSAWYQDGDKPWGAVEYSQPVFGDFFKMGRVPRFTEYGAIYFGDRSYSAEKDAYVQASLDALAAGAGKNENVDQVMSDFQKTAGTHVGEWTSYYDTMDLFIGNIFQSWRGYGMNGGLFPWALFEIGYGTPPSGIFDHPDPSLQQRPAWANPIYDTFRRVSQPLLVYLGGPVARFTAKDHDFYAGEAAQKSIIAVWDGPGPKNFKVQWSFVVGDRTIQQGTEQFALAPGAIEMRPLQLQMPAVTARSAGQVKITVWGADGASLGEDSSTLTVFPVLPQLAKTALRWAIYDPVGQTTQELAKLGVRPKSLQLGDSLSGVDVLVIGRQALAKQIKLPFSGDDVRRGLRVLFCEQGVDSLEALGFRVQDVVPRYVFARTPHHPALAGVQPEDLINWRGAGTLLPQTSEGMRVWPYRHAPHWGNYGSVASVVIETPHAGAFTPLLECEFDLAYSPLLEWREGQGTVVFCQLDLTGRIGHEPAADRLAANLVRYLDGAAPPTQGRSLLCLDDGAAAFVKQLGLEPAASATPLDPRAQVAVIGPDQFGVAADRIGELDAFVERGGTVVVLPQSAAHLQAAMPRKLAVSAEKVSHVQPEDIPLLTGIGPQLLHFRTFLDLQAFSQAPAGAQRLLGGILLQAPEGRGQWIFSQVDWRPLQDGSENLKRVRWNLLKFYRQLFTNCGARTETSLAQRFLAPVRYAPLVDVETWQLAINPAEIPPDTLRVQDVEGQNAQTGNWIALPALDKPLEGDAWLTDPAAPAWRLRGANGDGYVDFAALSTQKPGKVGFAVTYLYSSAARQASFALDSDWWFILKVNGQTYVDQGKAGRLAGPPRKGFLRLKIPLQAGWNRVELRVASGGGGFGFWCQVSDPGDLRVAPVVAAPGYTPEHVPAPADLLADQTTDTGAGFYAEPLTREDDPYGYTPW
jgi:beta-galactosidase